MFNDLKLTRWEIWACLDAHKHCILAEIDERHTRSSSSIDQRRCLFLVFISVSLEKPSSQRYVVEKGSNVEIALFATIGYFWQQSTNNYPAVDLHGAVLMSSFSSISYCSCKVNFVSLSTTDLYGSLTQSNECWLRESTRIFSLQVFSGVFLSIRTRLKC